MLFGVPGGAGGDPSGIPEIRVIKVFGFLHFQAPTWVERVSTNWHVFWPFVHL